MKQTTRIFFVVQMLVIHTCILFGQIGINIENPLKVFHVDGAHDNNATAAPAASQIVNDVVVDSRGYIGVGTLAPQARLDIADSRSQSIAGLRIVDGSTMANKVLESGANGVARWTERPPYYTRSFVAKPSQQFYFAIGQELLLDNKIIIPQNGRYLLTLRWWSYNVGSVYLTHPGLCSIYVYLMQRNAGGDVELDQIEYYLEAIKGDAITFTTSFYAGYQSQGQELYLLIKPVIGSNSMPGLQQQLMNSADYIPKVILYSI